MKLWVDGIPPSDEGWEEYADHSLTRDDVPQRRPKAVSTKQELPRRALEAVGRYAARGLFLDGDTMLPEIAGKLAERMAES